VALGRYCCTRVEPGGVMGNGGERIRRKTGKKGYQKGQAAGGGESLPPPSHSSPASQNRWAWRQRKKVQGVVHAARGSAPMVNGKPLFWRHRHAHPGGGAGRHRRRETMRGISSALLAGAGGPVPCRLPALSFPPAGGYGVARHSYLATASSARPSFRCRTSVVIRVQRRRDTA
jgi:hypothetical protein